MLSWSQSTNFSFDRGGAIFGELYKANDAIEAGRSTDVCDGFAGHGIVDLNDGDGSGRVKINGSGGDDR